MCLLYSFTFLYHFFFFSSRRRHTRFALVTGVQTCALPIYQIIACVGDDPIERLVVVSPYWDSKLEGIARLKAGLGNPVTDILIEDDANGFPVSELPRLSDVALFDISPNAAGRFLHRSEEHTSELQSLMRISYAVFCLK